MINVLNEKFYENLNGGLLESLGKLFHKDVKLYLYPYKFGNEIIKRDNMIVPDKFEHLFKHLIQNDFIVDYENYDEEILHIFSNKVLQKIKEGDTEWEKMVPPIVARIIKAMNLFKWSNRKFKKVDINFENMSHEH